MAAVWPPSLPRGALLDGYKESRPSTLLRSDMDTGPAKVRRRGNAKPQSVTAAYLLDDEQLAVLDQFVDEVLHGGAVAFDWPHPRLAREVRAAVVPQGEALYEVQPYETTKYWQVTLSLEVWPDAPLA